MSVVTLNHTAHIHINYILPLNEARRKQQIQSGFPPHHKRYCTSPSPNPKRNISFLASRICSSSRLSLIGWGNDQRWTDLGTESAWWAPWCRKNQQKLGYPGKSDQMSNIFYAVFSWLQNHSPDNNGQPSTRNRPVFFPNPSWQQQNMFMDVNSSLKKG